MSVGGVVDEDVLLAMPQLQTCQPQLLNTVMSQLLATGAIVAMPYFPTKSRNSRVKFFAATTFGPAANETTGGGDESPPPRKPAPIFNLVA